jgi:hypothetical protein
MTVSGNEKVERIGIPAWFQVPMKWPGVSVMLKTKSEVYFLPTHWIEKSSRIRPPVRVFFEVMQLQILGCVMSL